MVETGKGLDHTSEETVRRRGESSAAFKHEAVRLRFAVSYNDLKASGVFSRSGLSVMDKLEIAKYAMFAPQAVKAMAKCGSSCLLCP